MLVDSKLQVESDLPPGEGPTMLIAYDAAWDQEPV